MSLSKSNLMCKNLCMGLDGCLKAIRVYIQVHVTSQFYEGEQRKVLKQNCRPGAGAGPGT